MSRRSSLDLISIMKQMEDIDEEELDNTDGTARAAEEGDVFLEGDDDEEEEDDDDVAEIVFEDFSENVDDDAVDYDEVEGEEAEGTLFSPPLWVVEETTEVSIEEEDSMLVFSPEEVAESEEGVGVGARPLGPLYEESETDASPHLRRGDEEDLYKYYDEYDEIEPSSRFSSSTPIIDSSASGISSEAGKRQSFASVRSSLGSEAEISVCSAPARAGGIPENLNADRRLQQRRRVTITVPKDGATRASILEASQPNNASPQRAGRQRQSRYRSIRASGVSNLTDETSSSAANTNSTFFQSMRARSLLSTRRSGAMGGGPGSSNVNASMNPGSGSGDLAAAVDRLGSYENNSDWENAAAAAAVVAASVHAPKRNLVQFRTDENVLVLLNLLNITNRQDEKAHFTLLPVNKHGFPPGEGKTEEQRQGPYSFVLCTVCKVHFDEDERYYTVRRADTGSEQRADPGWMEPIEGADELEAAVKAALRTERSEAECPGQNAEQAGPCSWLVKTLSWPLRCARGKLIPCYRSTRLATKVLLEHFLRGAKGYACHFKLSFINLLVLCSFVYLLIEPFSIAFLSADLDYAAAIFELVVWSILLLELIFEFLIRPSNYHALIRSDKAYAPLMARHINRFHLVCESLALLLFIPQFPCVAKRQCGESIFFSLTYATMNGVLGVTSNIAAFGRFIVGLQFLRTFGLVRHWKNMWINDTFQGEIGPENSCLRRILLLGMGPDMGSPMNMFSRKRKSKGETDLTEDDPTDLGNAAASEEDKKLQMSATIGTALMLVNSHRALFLLLLISTIFPLIYTLGRNNTTGPQLVTLLQANNLAANTSADCDFLNNAVISWLRGSATEHTSFDIYEKVPDVFVLWAQVLPVRCAWQTEYPYESSDGVITRCPASLITVYEPCSLWNEYSPTPEEANASYFATEMGTRAGAILDLLDLQLSLDAPASFNETFSVRVILDENSSLNFTMSSLFILLCFMLLLTLVGLSVMRSDAQRLVLDPLQRMLRIVIRYAENPLSPTVSRKSKGQSSSDSQESKSGARPGGSKEELGNYETEQLITAISKIADLLRKCWGVAGAGIISSNLARTSDGTTDVFNPTVPGKRVYALFGFVAINDFSKLLRALEKDVMILINDVARVVHDEVYRWALGDSGQCNKNLGSAFLIVFRIGDFIEVRDKKKRATDVVFNSQMTRNAKLRRRSVLRKGGGKRGRDGRNDVNEHLQLASLPGIQNFSDRALLGLLKSFAGLHRDMRMQQFWGKDFRLGAGVGAFTASVIYGMDAGWAVEGAVGSEHKIDATYLSPHVNMASRMMSATKQYGVTILLSQAVEELLSRPAREKLRHLDTVYVKGSSVAQRIFTYDARYEGADFFLYDRSPEQADRDADSYTQMIWSTDQDLKAMRQHVTEDFMEKFKEGLDQYIAGDWPTAIETLEKADELMILAVIEEGYVEYDVRGLEEEVFNCKTTNDEVLRLRHEFGDGACKCLIQYMQRSKGIPPTDWQGVRHLMSK